MATARQTRSTAERGEASRLVECARRHGLDILVETGTYKADTVRSLRRQFRLIYSIELDERLHMEARRRCRGQRNAVLVHGDSGQVLREVLSKLREPAMFWLDAHYSGGATAGSSQDNPLLTEVQSILQHGIGGHAVLVDDYREVVSGRDGYPDARQLRHVADQAGYRVQVADDMLYMHAAPRSKVRP